MAQKSIVITCMGTRGDVQPLCALGLCLLARGWRVTIVAPEEFREFVADMGLHDFLNIGVSLQKEIMGTRRGHALRTAGSLSIVWAAYRFFSRDLLASWLSGVMHACEARRPTLLLLTNFVQLCGAALVPRLLQLPTKVALVHLIPGDATSNFQCPQAGHGFSAPKGLACLNKLTWHMSDSWMMGIYRRVAQRLVTAEAKLRNVSVSPLGPKLGCEEVLTLSAHSPALLPRPRDWGAHVHVVGALFSADVAHLEPSPLQRLQRAESGAATQAAVVRQLSLKLAERSPNPSSDEEPAPGLAPRKISTQVDRGEEPVSRRVTVTLADGSTFALGLPLDEAAPRPASASSCGAPALPQPEQRLCPALSGTTRLLASRSSLFGARPPPSSMPVAIPVRSSNGRAPAAPAAVPRQSPALGSPQCTLPASLQSFLKTAQARRVPVIYIGLGSMLGTVFDATRLHSILSAMSDAVAELSKRRLVRAIVHTAPPCGTASLALSPGRETTTADRQAGAGTLESVGSLGASTASLDPQPLKTHSSNFDAVLQKTGRLPCARPASLAFQEGAAYELTHPISHSELLPHCALVVHHGGAGTTHAVLAAGKPSAVIPCVPCSDQPFWAELTVGRGLGPGPVLSIADLTAASLLRLLERGLDRLDEYTTAAEKLGKRVAAEQGVFKAAELLEVYALGDVAQDELPL